MNTKKRSEIRRDLSRIVKEVRHIQIGINAENAGDEPFNFCTDAYLARAVESLKANVDAIHKTVFQEK